MKKSDLTTGMRVELRNGDLYMVLSDIESELYGHQDKFLVGDEGFMILDEYDDDLFCVTEDEFDWCDHEAHDREYDIVKVFDLEKEGTYLRGNLLDLSVKHLIWEREWSPGDGDWFYYPAIDSEVLVKQKVWTGDKSDQRIKRLLGVYNNFHKAERAAKSLGWNDL